MKDRGNFGLENRRVGRKIKGDGVIKIRALKDRISSADTSVGLGSVSINIQLTELPVFRSPVEAVAYYTKERKRGSDCLLYTSPSPRDGLLSRMPSSA